MPPCIGWHVKSLTVAWTRSVYELTRLSRRQIKNIVEGRPRRLIEAVAEDIADKILAEHSLVNAVTVHICKPHVAVEGVVQSLGKP